MTKTQKQGHTKNNQNTFAIEDITHMMAQSVGHPSELLFLKKVLNLNTLRCT